jgi:NADPH-dependent glutamate synthase beta subunit-like oxidoreductase
VYRRTRHEMPAQEEEVRAALEEGIVLQELATPVEVLGTSGKVNSVRCQRMALGEPDADGRRQAVPVKDSTFDLPADIVLVAVGEAPDPSFLPPGTSVGVAPWGGLLIDPTTLATGAPGVFAAGDVTYGPNSIILAAAHGRKAAQQIHAFLRHLQPNSALEMPEGSTETMSTLPVDGRVALDLRPSPRAEMPLHIGVSRDRSAEAAAGFSETQAQLEASRCLRCDLAYLCPTIVARRAEKVAGTAS